MWNLIERCAHARLVSFAPKKNNCFSALEKPVCVRAQPRSYLFINMCEEQKGDREDDVDDPTIVEHSTRNNFARGLGPRTRLPMLMDEEALAFADIPVSEAEAKEWQRLAGDKAGREARMLAYATRLRTTQEVVCPKQTCTAGAGGTPVHVCPGFGSGPGKAQAQAQGEVKKDIEGVDDAEDEDDDPASHEEKQGHGGSAVSGDQQPVTLHDAVQAYQVDLVRGCLEGGHDPNQLIFLSVECSGMGGKDGKPKFIEEVDTVLSLLLRKCGDENTEAVMDIARMLIGHPQADVELMARTVAKLEDMHIHTLPEVLRDVVAECFEARGVNADFLRC
jgi:hypothetical protein